MLLDDWGTQERTFISPKLFNEFFRPCYSRIVDRSHELGLDIGIHSCGNVYRLIGDFIEMGVDLLNPVQVSAGEMGDTARLKREFGDRLSFCGAIDTQKVLPTGTPEDVRAEVRRRIADLAPGGGYVAGAVHCLQPDVPVENVLAMCDEVLKAGRYPLQIRS